MIAKPTFSREVMVRAGMRSSWVPVSRTQASAIGDLQKQAADEAEKALAVVRDALGLAADAPDVEIAITLQKLYDTRHAVTRTEAAAVFAAAAAAMVEADPKLSYGEAQRRLAHRLPGLVALTRRIDR